MSHIGEKIKQERIKRGLSIEELSKRTTVRAHVIEAIESGNFTIMQEFYIKSFIKKLCKYLEIKEEIDFIPDEFIQKTKEEEPILIDEKETKAEQRKQKLNKKEPKKVTTSTQSQSNSDYSEIFKKKKVKYTINSEIINYVIYSAVALFLILAIYFIFFFDSKKIFEEKQYLQDTTKIEEQADNVLAEFFTKTDSLTIKAVARDTAWLRIEIDGQKSEELLMYPGMERSWNAWEYVIINQGNFGAIKYYRNDEAIEISGKRGSVVKNIRITRNEIVSSTPWSDDPTTKIDAIKEVPKNTRRYRDQKNNQLQIIEPSQPVQKTPLKKDTLR